MTDLQRKHILARIRRENAASLAAFRSLPRDSQERTFRYLVAAGGSDYWTEVLRQELETEGGQS